MREQAHRRRAEDGSAYIIALMVLVVLSLLGLGLALVSQTELQIGSNELTTHRALYNAESGVALGLARKMIVNSSTAESDTELTYRLLFVIPEPRETLDAAGNPVEINPTTATTHFGEAVEVSPMIRVQEVPCDLCNANTGTGVKLVSATYAMVSRSDRIVWTGDSRFNVDPYIPSGGGSAINPDFDKIINAPHTATKQVYAMKGISPWWPARPEAQDADAQQVTQQVLGAGQ